MAFRRKRIINLEENDNTTVKLGKVEKKGWGKKERGIVLVVVASTFITALLLAFVSRNGKLPGLPRISSESIGLSDTVIVTKTELPPDTQKRQSDTVANFSDTVSKLSGVYAFSAVDLVTGDRYGLNDTEQMQAASLIKLPVMALLLKRADEGKINLDAVYKLKNSDKVGGSGSLIGRPEGTELSYRTLLEYMGKQSDNTAFNIIRKKLGDEEITSYINEIGMKKTDIKENMTSPSDIALLFEKLYQGRLVSIKSRDLLLQDITDTIYEEHLKKGVPEETRVAHKYGRELHVVNDAGIVYAKNPYVVVIMTGGVVEREADTIFPLLSQIIYEGQS